MSPFPLLSLILFLPLLGALFIFLIQGEEKVVAHNARSVALLVTSVTLLLVGNVIFQFDLGNPHLQFVESKAWIPFLEARYHLAVDGLSLGFVTLTAFLIPIAILSSGNSIRSRVREYMIAFLVLESFLMGAFCAQDLVLFYVFFESVLIPMFFIIGIWGGERRLYATLKFFLFTLTGSLLMFVAILAVYSEVGTTNLATILLHRFSMPLQLWGWVAFFIAFAIKTPLWPVHTWLPDAHVEAPTGGSIVLAGLLLKLGGYGILRFLLPLFPLGTLYWKPYAIAFAFITVLYASFVTLVQKDVKRLIAYSSVAHMGVALLGIFTLTVNGIAGGIVQMLSHGLISAALFLCIGILYERLKTRELDKMGGLIRLMPILSVLFLVFVLAGLGLPGLSGFVGEFLIILSTLSVSLWIALGLACSLVLSAAYGLRLYGRIFYGKLPEGTPTPESRSATDLTARDFSLLAPMAFLVVAIGIYPKTLLTFIMPSVELWVNQHQEYLRKKGGAKQKAKTVTGGAPTGRKTKG